MKNIYLFTDGSVHTKSKLGYGAYLFIKDDLIFHESMKHEVFLKSFTETSSTKLELQALIWALNENQ